MEEPEPLYVDCRACGSPVPTGLHLTSAVYELTVQEERELTCRNCGTTGRFTKAAFHILGTTSVR